MTSRFLQDIEAGATEGETPPKVGEQREVPPPRLLGGSDDVGCLDKFRRGSSCSPRLIGGAIAGASILVVVVVLVVCSLSGSTSSSSPPSTQCTALAGFHCVSEGTCPFTSSKGVAVCGGSEECCWNKQVPTDVTPKEFWHYLAELPREQVSAGGTCIMTDHCIQDHVCLPTRAGSRCVNQASLKLKEDGETCDASQVVVQCAVGSICYGDPSQPAQSATCQAVLRPQIRNDRNKKLHSSYYAFARGVRVIVKYGEHWYTCALKEYVLDGFWSAHVVCDVDPSKVLKYVQLEHVWLATSPPQEFLDDLQKHRLAGTDDTATSSKAPLIYDKAWSLRRGMPCLLDVGNSSRCEAGTTCAPDPERGPSCQAP